MSQKYGHEANNTQGAAARKTCVVCDDPSPHYTWTDYSGEGICMRCGTPYQLKWGSDKQVSDGMYPYLNVREEAVPMFRRYFAETNSSWGGGTYLGLRDYPEIADARQQFNHWWDAHKDEYPDLQKKSD
jgi:hypothetical protein